MLYCLSEDNFHTLDVENLRLHYNKTLRCWEQNYREHIDEVKEMFDEKFARMWSCTSAPVLRHFITGLLIAPDSGVKRRK